MSFHPPFPEPAKEYIRQHMDDSRSVLAYRVYALFGYPCTKEGVKGVIRRIRREHGEPVQTEAKAAA